MSIGPLPDYAERDDRAAHWQARWEAADLGRVTAGDPAARDAGDDPKFMMIFAYPGVSGYLHVGHMRGFTYTDVITRFHRQQGQRVLFPVGFHASGLPAVGFAMKVQRDLAMREALAEQGEAPALADPDALDAYGLTQLAYLSRNGCPPDVMTTLNDVRAAVDYFATTYIEEDWKRFGFLCDWNRTINTIAPDYNRFIDWQFRKLEQQDLLVSGVHYAPYAEGVGPVAVDASETDLSQGGKAEQLTFHMHPFALPDGRILPCATLRPETIYGATNAWLHPTEPYVEVHVPAAQVHPEAPDRTGEETWIVTQPAAQKVLHQFVDVRVGQPVPNAELLGAHLSHPLLERTIPVLPATFVDPHYATGAVVSVPAHAPYDHQALVDLAAHPERLQAVGLDAEVLADVEPVTIITLEGWGDNPAAEACERFGVTDQDDHAALERATQEVYKAEFNTGVMNEACGEFSGHRVKTGKDVLIEAFTGRGLLNPLHEFSERVIARNGADVVVKRIEDQWFIDYANEALTERAIAHASGTMTIQPEDYQAESTDALTWFGRRACIRAGSWLGTEFPFKADWTIEPISDSTLYPVWYTIAHLVNDGRLPVAALTEPVLDHIFLGEGEAAAVAAEVDLDVEVLEEARREFLYWYPLDINLGGKEHRRVHFPPFIMNHVAILEERHWPQGIFVNFWVTAPKGGGADDKISKSKGGAQPVPEAIEHYGVDALRLYYCHVGSAHSDIEWVPERVEAYRAQTYRLWDLPVELAAWEGGPSDVDDWLLVRLAERQRTWYAAMEANDLRSAAQASHYDLLADLAWYKRRGGANPATGRALLEAWAPMLMPMTPHLAEEWWAALDGDGMLSASTWTPPAAPSEDELLLLARERYLQALLDQARQVRDLAARHLDAAPVRLVVQTAPSWKRDLGRTAIELQASGYDLKQAMKVIMTKPFSQEPTIRKLVPKLWKKVLKQLHAWRPDERALITSDLDETEVIAAAAAFIASELSLTTVDVWTAGDGDDVGGKADVAFPLEPGFAFE